MSKLSDCWETPPDLFVELDKKYGPFKVDLCAIADNSQCEYYFKDFLKDDFVVHKELMLVKPIWEDDLKCFMNPPYSHPKPFIERAWELSKRWSIVCLVKCDPSTKWWATFWDYENDCALPGCKIKFFPKRIKFLPPRQLNLEVVGNKYKIKCDDFDSIGSSKNSFLDKSPCGGLNCLRCKGLGYRWANVAGASFPCAVVIMDRRNLTNGT